MLVVLMELLGRYRAIGSTKRSVEGGAGASSSHSANVKGLVGSVAMK